jgi:hypothetical protein
MMGSALVLIASSLLLRGQSAPDASLRLRPGDRWVYTLRQNFEDFESSDPVESDLWRVTMEVRSANDSGFDVETATHLVESAMGGEKVPPAKGAKPVIEKVRFTARGERTWTKETTDDPVEFRLDRLTWFVIPEKPAAEWVVKLPGNEGGSVPEAELGVRYVSRQKIEDRYVLRFSLSFTEKNLARPIRGTGEALIDEASGVPQKITWDVVNAPLPGGTDTYRLKVELNTIELRVSARR